MTTHRPMRVMKRMLWTALLMMLTASWAMGPQSTFDTNDLEVLNAATASLSRTVPVIKAPNTHFTPQNTPSWSDSIPRSFSIVRSFVSLSLHNAIPARPELHISLKLRESIDALYAHPRDNPDMLTAIALLGLLVLFTIQVAGMGKGVLKSQDVFGTDPCTHCSLTEGTIANVGDLCSHLGTCSLEYSEGTAVGPQDKRKAIACKPRLARHRPPQLEGSLNGDFILDETARTLSFKPSRVRFGLVHQIEMEWSSSGTCKHGMEYGWTCTLGMECSCSVDGAEEMRLASRKLYKRQYNTYGRHAQRGYHAECPCCDVHSGKVPDGDAKLVSAYLRNGNAEVAADEVPTAA